MFEYQIHQQRSAELRRRAEQDRLAREALRALRAARRSAARDKREAKAHSDGPRPHRFTRAA